jgi:hypothetical protein
MPALKKTLTCSIPDNQILKYFQYLIQHLPGELKEMVKDFRPDERIQLEQKNKINNYL